MPDPAFADGWEAGGRKKPNAPARAALFDLAKDPGETNNHFPKQAGNAKRLAALLAKAQTRPVTRPE